MNDVLAHLPPPLTNAPEMGYIWSSFREKTRLTPRRTRWGIIMVAVAEQNCSAKGCLLYGRENADY
jgi:hypothetical protein